MSGGGAWPDRQINWSRAEEYGIYWFITHMAIKLDQNRHKAGWDDIDLDYAIMRLRQEVDELADAIDEYDHGARTMEEVAREVIGEAADVANFAFMIAYKVRH